MNINSFTNELKKFIDYSTCSFTCINTIKQELNKKGFIELDENSKWDLSYNKYYVIRNNASIIAFTLPKINTNHFSIITTHCDTPALLLKPNSYYEKNNYLKYNVMLYGGLLNFGWLDHPLSLAGRIITKDNNKLKINIVDFRKPLLIIPSLAIHLNADENSNLDLNMQKDMEPILGLDNTKWQDIIKDYKNIIDYDLFAYNPLKPTFIGSNNELLISPRIDNITSVYAGLKGFLNSKNSTNIKVFCAFNNEEIGSLSIEGADSNFLLDTLKHISSSLNIDISTSLANSFIISADNTHGIHPNHPEYADNPKQGNLNQGFAIIRESNSTTNSISSSIIKEICHKHHLKYQDITTKNDISTGSTLSTLSLRHVSILSIDIGICQLSMHSSIETCSIYDIYELFKLMKYYYNSKIEIKKGIIKIS